MTARGRCSAAGQKAVRKLRRTGKETEKAAVNVAVPLNESGSQPRVEQSVQSARSILVSAFWAQKGIVEAGRIHGWITHYVRASV